jgi:transposase
LLRLLSRLGVACDVIPPSLIPVRAGIASKTDRRDANKLVRIYRAVELAYVQPPTPETEGVRDLLRCREDLRRARTGRASSRPEAAVVSEEHADAEVDHAVDHELDRG